MGEIRRQETALRMDTMKYLLRGWLRNLVVPGHPVGPYLLHGKAAEYTVA